MAKVCVEFDADGTTPVAGAKYYMTTLGDGTTASFNVVHNLGSLDVTYWLRNALTGDLDAFDVEANGSNPNVLLLKFATPPAANSVRLNLLAPPVATA